MRVPVRGLVVGLFVAACCTSTLLAQGAQAGGGVPVARLRAEPTALSVEAGSSAPLRIVALGADGNEVEADIRYAAPRNALRVADGKVTGLKAGEYQVVASAVLPPTSAGAPPTVTVPVTVTWPSVARVEVHPESGRLYVGTVLAHRAAAFHGDGSARPMPTVRWSSSDPSMASVDRYGAVAAHRPGAVTIRAEVDGTRGTVEHRATAFPAERLEITGGADQVRTGEVLTLDARGLRAGGGAVADLPITWSYTFVPDDSIAAPGAAGTVLGGKFVAEVPGRYTVLATSGPLTARRTVDVRPRGVVQRVREVGHGAVRNVHTSDLWVFQGRDGRDYALTGTWGADGQAYVWDVTNPANMIKTDSIRVDARTVNDVKVSPDARYAALSREGASNRRNGVVILDLANPAHPTIASVFDEGLTGGVHNMFATNDHLFALSAGDKYVILDVPDLKNPRFVSEYNHPDSRIHDVWVQDGIAYSSEWGTGAVVVDVGNGRWGGTIEKPVFVTSIPYPVGRTHAAVPYHQKSTGKFYLFLGDEILSRAGLPLEGQLSVAPYNPETGEGGVPSTSTGYIHVIDFTDPKNPIDVARYEVPEFGTHNLWVEDDKLYQAYYEGGLRIVDVSGELMGNLAEQGREIAVFRSNDPVGFIPNAPMVWGAQPHKGTIFFSDFNSGLWAVRLEPSAAASARR